MRHMRQSVQHHQVPRQYIENALEIHELFNLAQMLQGENLPANIGELRRCIDEKSHQLSLGQLQDSMTLARLEAPHNAASRLLSATLR